MGFGFKNSQTRGFNGQKITFIFKVFSLRFRLKFWVTSSERKDIHSKNGAALKPCENMIACAMKWSLNLAGSVRVFALVNMTKPLLVLQT